MEPNQVALESSEEDLSSHRENPDQHSIQSTDVGRQCESSPVDLATWERGMQKEADFDALYFGILLQARTVNEPSL